VSQLRLLAAPGNPANCAINPKRRGVVMKPNEDERALEGQVVQGEKPRCKCQWINVQTAALTPDDHEAIALATCHDPRSFGEKGSDPFPICENHAKQKGEYWKLLPLPGQTEAEEHRMVSEDRRSFRVVSDVVIASVRKSFPDQAQEILKDLRWRGDHFAFNRWGMYVGVETDGHIHT